MNLMKEEYKKYLPVPIEDVLPMEIWFPVVGYEGIYEVSCLGRVRSLNYRKSGKARVLKQQRNRDGYLQVRFCNGLPSIHRIVCEFFYGIPEGWEVDHQNWIRDDNRFINIQPLPKSENSSRKSEKGIKAIVKNSAENGRKSSSKPVLQFDLDGNFIAEYPSTREVERQLGFYHTFISSNCNGKNKSAYGFKWKYAS